MSKNVITSITDLVKTRRATATVASLSAIILGTAVVASNSAAIKQLNDSGLVSTSDDIKNARSIMGWSTLFGVLLLGGGLVAGGGLLFGDPRIRMKLGMKPF